jgi:hypothetical protein
MIKDSFVRRLATDLAVLAGIAIVCVVALQFILADAAAQADAIVKYRTETAQISGDLSALVDLQRDSGASAPYAAAVNRLLPQEDGLIGFPQEAQALAASYSLSAQAMLTGNPTAPTGGAPGFVPFSLIASGSADNFLPFLHALQAQSALFLVALDSVDVQFSASGNQLSITGKVFFQ